MRATARPILSKSRLRATYVSFRPQTPHFQRAGVITKAPILRTLQTKIDARVALAREISALLKEFAGTAPLHTGIRLNARMAEAPGQQQTLFDYSPGATAVADYAAVAEELVS